MIPGANPSEIDQIKKSLERFLSNIPVDQILLFGSRVDGSFTERSDLDILIISPEKIPLEKLEHIRDFFEESDLRFRVDLLDSKRISPEILKSILNQKHSPL